MILKSNHPMTSGQPIHDFLMLLTEVHEKLDPVFSEQIDEPYCVLLRKIHHIHHTHCELPTLREGDWYLHQTLDQAWQNVAASAAEARDTASRLQEMMAEESAADPDFRELTDLVILFCGSVISNPRILDRTHSEPAQPQL